MSIPARYSFLERDPEPPLLVQKGLQLLGTLEGGGSANNRSILAWADEVAKGAPTPYSKWAADWYNSDSVAWCGLYVALCAVRSANGQDDRLPPKNYLSALAWASFGRPVQFRGREGLRLGEILVGDIAVFVRAGGGHVAIVVGVSADGKYIVCLGGNQDNAVSIKSFPIGRLYAVRRPPYKVQPPGARHVRLTGSGPVSTNEA